MDIAAKLDGVGRGGWIVATILAFIIFWPLGLLLLGYLVFSGRAGSHYYGRNSAMREEWMAHKRKWAERVARNCMHQSHAGRSSGNAAFDAYKEETLKRLEEEQEEFTEFLERLRQSKDKAEFDQFMAERRKSSNDNPSERGESNGGGNGDQGRTPPTIDY